MEQTNNNNHTTHTLDSMCWRDCCVRVRESENVATTKNAIRNRDWYIERSSSFEQTKNAFCIDLFNLGTGADNDECPGSSVSALVSRKKRKPCPTNKNASNQVWAMSPCTVKGECGDGPHGDKSVLLLPIHPIRPRSDNEGAIVSIPRFQWEYTREVKAVWFCHMQNAQ